MIYRKFQDLPLSALGMGAMRLPVIDGDDGKIDEPAVQKMVDYAMSRGSIITIRPGATTAGIRSWLWAVP